MKYYTKESSGGERGETTNMKREIPISNTVPLEYSTLMAQQILHLILC